VLIYAIGKLCPNEAAINCYDAIVGAAVGVDVGVRFKWDTTVTVFASIIGAWWGYGIGGWFNMGVPPVRRFTANVALGAFPSIVMQKGAPPASSNIIDYLYNLEDALATAIMSEVLSQSLPLECAVGVFATVYRTLTYGSRLGKGSVSLLSIISGAAAGCTALYLGWKWEPLIPWVRPSSGPFSNVD
jgi:hypothetical protein